MVEEKIKFIEQEFNSYYKEVRIASEYIFALNYGGYDGVENEDLEFSQVWTHEYLYRMYNLLCVYFELLQLHDYLEKFKKEFECIITDKKKATKMSSILLTYGDTDDDLFLLIEWKKFLAPFSFYWKNENKENTKLIQLLESTNEILKLTKTIVKKEEDINSVIREIADLYYEDVSAYSVGYFRHKFTSYKPDVIIGELNVSIEYKLIRENKDVGTKIDELLIDAKRYTDNHLNKECIAVFCLSTKVTKTKKQINEDWKKMLFPKNWKLIVINDVAIV
ncbi:MAG: hypothetical protein GZ091_14165 [Paludibacter sp.]|nr:hypothetical protein [Paludibacter sp.]